MSVLRDLAEISHWLSVIKIAPDAADDPTTPPAERDRGRDMAARLPQRVLGRAWQMLLKAIEEVPLAPNAMMAAEMAVIRLTHVSDLPDPATLIRKLQSSAPPAVLQPTAVSGNGGNAPRAFSATPRPASTGGPATALATQVDPLGLPQPQSFAEVMELIRARRDLKLLHEVENGLRLVHFAPGRIEFEPGPAAPTDLAARLGQRLTTWTGNRWGVSVVGTGGGPTIAEQQQAELRAVTDEAAEIPLVAAVMAAFPGARITEIRTPDARIDQARDAALPEVDDEWDPFEDD
jgi:DNA polymerase III subunit gamma/tau